MSDRLGEFLDWKQAWNSTGHTMGWPNLTSAGLWTKWFKIKANSKWKKLCKIEWPNEIYFSRCRVSSLFLNKRQTIQIIKCVLKLIAYVQCAFKIIHSIKAKFIWKLDTAHTHLTIKYLRSHLILHKYKCCIANLYSRADLTLMCDLTLMWTDLVINPASTSSSAYQQNFKIHQEWNNPDHSSSSSSFTLKTSLSSLPS